MNYVVIREKLGVAQDKVPGVYSAPVIYHKSHEIRREQVLAALVYLYGPVFVRRTGIEANEFTKLIETGPLSYLQMIGGSSRLTLMQGRCLAQRLARLLEQTALEHRVHVRDAQYIDVIAFFAPQRFDDIRYAESFISAAAFRIDEGKTDQYDGIAVEFDKEEIAELFFADTVQFHESLSAKHSFANTMTRA